MTSPLILPFKPYRIDEVMAITGAPFVRVEKWWREFEMRVGEDSDKTVGLDAVQTFAVFVGNRFLEEGADVDRAEDMIRAVLTLGFGGIDSGIKRGLTFLYHRPKMMVACPAGRLGIMLNMDRLKREFIERVKRVFPES